MPKVQLLEIRYVAGLVIATLVSARASFWFFKGGLTGSPPLYSHGCLQRTLHIFARILFAALMLFASVELYSHLSVASTSSLKRADAAVVNSQQNFTGYPPSAYMKFFQACSPEKPCTREDDFQVDPLPKGCCTLLLTNGDGKGNDEVFAYEVFMNGKRVLPEGSSRNAANISVQASNKIKLVLTGKASAKVFVLIAYDPRQSE